MIQRILGLLALTLFLIPGASGQDFFPTPGEDDNCRTCPIPLETTDTSTNGNITAVGCAVKQQAEDEWIASFIFWVGENFGPNIPRPPEGEDPPEGDPPGGEEPPTGGDEEPPTSPTGPGDGEPPTSPTGDEGPGTSEQAPSTQTCVAGNRESALAFRDQLDLVREGARFSPRGASMPRGMNVRLMTKREWSQRDRSEFVATFMVQASDGARVPVVVQALKGKLFVRTMARR